MRRPHFAEAGLLLGGQDFLQLVLRFVLQVDDLLLLVGGQVQVVAREGRQYVDPRTPDRRRFCGIGLSRFVFSRFIFGQFLFAGGVPCRVGRGARLSLVHGGRRILLAVAACVCRLRRSPSCAQAG
jgi:hypothetical protein